MTPGPSTEQLLVQVALRALDEVLVRMAEHGPASTQRDRAQEEVELAFKQLWYRLSSLDFRCTNEGLEWGDLTVLSSDDGKSILMATLASSGIQSLRFAPGAETKDVRRFADLIDEKAHRDAHAGKDLVMMLFEADLPHVSYSVRAAPSEPTRAPPPDPPRPPEATELRETIRADAETDVGSGVVDLEAFDSTLYFLDQREIEYLQGEVEKQYALDHTRSVLDLLLDTLELQSSDSTRSEVIGAIGALLPYLLGSGRFTSLAYLTDELRGVLRTVELGRGHRESLKAILQSISRKGALTQIFLTLEDERVTPTADGVEALVRQLDHRALETVLVWGGQLRRTEARTAVFGALETTFMGRPDHLARLLVSGQRAVVQEGLRMAARLRLEDLVEAVTTTLDHEDPAIRRQAVEVLGAIPGVASMRGVARMLQDPDAGVRTASYQVFLNRPYRSAARGIRAVLASTDLESLSLSERKLLLSAYGAVAGPEDTSEIVGMLAGRRFFGRRPSSETRACATLALARIGTPPARSALTDAQRDSDPLVRNAARVALQEEA